MITEKQPEALPSQEMFAAQAQEFASAWAIVGGRFDVTGNGMETAREEKATLLDMARRLYARIAELEAQLEAVGAGGVTALAQKPPTVPDNMQGWKGMDGATAFHLIERHADNWADTGKMMHEWLAANKETP